MTNSINEAFEQLEDLQMKVAYQEDVIQSLNDELIKQGSLIVRLDEQVQLLNQKLKHAEDNVGQNEGKSFDERPPHY